MEKLEFESSLCNSKILTTVLHCELIWNKIRVKGDGNMKIKHRKRRNSLEAINKGKIVGLFSMDALVLNFLGTKQKAVTMPVLCPLKEQTGETNTHGIICQ